MKAYLKQVLIGALSGIEHVPDDFEPELMPPANPEHGDLATNCALKLARHLRRSPHQIAEDLVQRLASAGLDKDRIAVYEVAGPGFINFRFSSRYWYLELQACLDEHANYGRTQEGTGKRALVEFVSANPTGPLTVGHGRNAVLGDTIANLLEWTGYDVTREYYFNDAGRQMRVLGVSVRGRCDELLADASQPFAREPKAVAHRQRYATKKLVSGRGQPVAVSTTFPDDGYLGSYITDIAQALVNERRLSLLEETGTEVFTAAAKLVIFTDIKATLQRLGIRMDTYFNEHSLYESGAVAETLEALRAAGFVYEKDQAQWLKTTDLGKEKDTVLVKRSGEPTYRLPDIAYHRNKCVRGYDVIIDIFGADHIATYPDVLRGLRILGYDDSRVEVIIYQFVTLVCGGEEVKMSTRKANFVTLDELIEDVGPDVTRYFFLMRSAQRHLEFDLDLAREASDKNPVFYLQYAHARICSILRKAKETGFVFDRDIDLTQLTHTAELALIKEIVQFPQVVARIALAREPHRLTSYLRGVAEAFTRFYHACRIIGEPSLLATARMALAQATRVVLRNGLSILGLAAPTHM